MRDSKTAPNTPFYCRQKRPTGSDLAFVDLNGQRHYLGVYDTSESREKYHRLLAEWTACNGFLKPKAEELTVNELCARFLLHAKIYYRRPDGTPSPEAKNFDPIFRLLRQLYGGEKASVFGPTALKAVREKMIDLDWSRYHVNKQVGRLKMIFKWGVSEEIVPPSVHQALLTVDGLKRGRCRARESEAIKPVPETYIEAIRPLTVMHGGDTDTNAAIAGALLGAVHGLKSIPSQWKESVLACRPIKGTPGVYQPRPQQFWPTDALELAESLLVTK